MIESRNIIVSKRPDGKKRYRLTLPKKLGDMEGIIEGKFIYNSKKKFINFIVVSSWKKGTWIFQEEKDEEIWVGHIKKNEEIIG